jgi:hypothetical protein
MTALLVADLRRILWRPMTRALSIAAIVAIIAAGAIVFLRTGAPHPFDPLTGLRTALEAAAIPLALAGFVLGGSLLGADYTSRALTTLLTWEPRRSRVLVARAATCAGFTACSSFALLVVLAVALLPATAFHGTGHALPTSWYLSMVGLAARCALLAAAASVMGMSCAAIGRSTTAALVSFGVYLLIVERTAVSVVPSVGRWLLVSDAVSWIDANPHSGIGGSGGNVADHGVAVAGLLLLGGVITLSALASWALRKRDFN